MDYYIKLGIDHIFIYDDKDLQIDKMINIINKKDYEQYSTIYDNIKV